MPLVLGYHRMVENFQAAAANSIAPMLISVRTFERQLDWIGRRFEFIALDDFAAWTEGRRRFNRPVAAITFDDGYADLYHHGFPILKRKGIPAAVFVVSDLVGTPRLQTYDELYLLLSSSYLHWHNPRQSLIRLLRSVGIAPLVVERLSRATCDSLRATWALIENVSRAEIVRVADVLRTEVEISDVATQELRSVDWEMLREMSRSVVTVGSHTRTHVYLTQESSQTVLDETAGSRRKIERKLGMPVQHFAYPSGGFNASVVRAVAAAGYRCAYTTCRHRDARYPALTVPRRLLWENACMDAFGRFSPALMSCQVSGVFDFVPSCRQAHALQ